MGVNRRGHNSSGSGKSNKHRGIGGNKHRGPRHGHGNRGKGGGNPYGSNNVNMTIGQAKKIYANQLAAGISLQDAMRHNKAETVSYWDLLDDKGDSKQSNSNTPNSNTTNNNTMTLTRAQQEARLKTSYNTAFGAGRDPSFGTTGGADYWLDTHNPQTDADWAEIDRMLQGSDEGVKYAASVAAGNPTVLPGGIDPTKSIASQAGPGTWASHFLPGGTFQDMNAAHTIGAIADDIGYTPSSPYFNNSLTPPPIDDDDDGTVTPPVQDGWWNQFADANAFKDFLFGDKTDDDGMGDFMKFMMLMSIMRPQGGGYGGGYGGSQYGYGGLNPGGVQAAYDPLQQLQGMGNWFKTNFGSGSGSGGATTSTVNTGNAGN